MTLKRVLVLVMALVMVVSACAPSVLAAYKPETKHEHLEDVLNNPEYAEKYEEIKTIVETIAKDIEENHEEYYAGGYAYALENGYIDTAIETIKETLETIREIDLEGVEMTDELRGELETELDALVPTLEKLLKVLESGEASEFDGFVKAVLTFEGDLYLHMNNIYAILEQASIDLNQFALVPAFNEALRLLEEEIIPAIEETVEAYVDYVVEVLTPYYEKAVEVIGIAYDTYELLVETIVKINLYVENAIDLAVGTFNSLVAKLVEFYENAEDAVRNACDIYNKVIDTVTNVVETLVKFNADVREQLQVFGETIDKAIVAIVKVYERTLDILVKAYGSIENAIVVAGQVHDYVMNIILENIELFESGVEAAAELLYTIYADIVEIVNNAPGEANAFVSYMATELAAYILGIVSDIEAFLNDLDAHIAEKDYGALNGSYELKDNSSYVALGNSPFAEELAEMLHLSDKYSQSGLRAGNGYLNAVAHADIITINVDGGEFLTFAAKQVSGTVASIVRSNDRLMELYEHPFVGGYVSSVVSGYGINIDAETEELDWDKYLNAENKEMLENALALAKAELIERGIPEYYHIDLQPIVDEALEENGLAGLPGFAITMDPIEVPVADIVVYAIESALYAYARYTDDLGALLADIYVTSPKATVVLLGIENPLEGLSVDLSAFGIEGVDFDDCLAISDLLIKTFNVQLYAAAAKNEKTVFVPEHDAEAIYDAIHPFCNHVYDDCEDEECNRCFEVRKAPGHSFTNYVYNNDATCEEDGTKTAVCTHCGATDTKVAENTELGHDWAGRTCTSAAKCTRCGAINNEEGPSAHDYTKATCTEDAECRDCGDVKTKALGHNFGNWKTTVEPTRKTEGLEEHVCKRCGLLETRVLPVIPPKYSAGTIVAVILSAVFFAIAVSTIVLWLLRKKDILK